MKNILLRLALGLSLTLALFGCKKKEEDPQPLINLPVMVDESFNQNLILNFNNTVGDKPVNFTSIFTTTTGHRFTLTSLRYYVSNIRLVKQDGSEHAIPYKYLLVNPSTPNYDLGPVPGGTYKGIKFAIGIDSATNHKDPTIHPVTHPLAIQSPGIHWSWNTGYIFTMIEGSCDTTVSNTDTLTWGQFSHGMFFHIGIDPLYRQVDLNNSSFTVAKASPLTLKIKTDFNKFLAGVDLKTENATHTLGSMPFATRIANNIPTMFSVLQ